jgi:hypothetical protein
MISNATTEEIRELQDMIDEIQGQDFQGDN